MSKRHLLRRIVLAAAITTALGPSLVSTAAAGGSGYSTYRDRLGFGNTTHAPAPRDASQAKTIGVTE